MESYSLGGDGLHCYKCHTLTSVSNSTGCSLSMLLINIVTGLSVSSSSGKVTSSSHDPTATISSNVKPCRSRVFTGATSTVSKKLFHISGHNGDSILQSICLSHGWIPLDDVKSDQFFFKWTELRKYIDYTKFREGNIIVTSNHGHKLYQQVNNWLTITPT